MFVVGVVDTYMIDGLVDCRLYHTLVSSNGVRMLPFDLCECCMRMQRGVCFKFCGSLFVTYHLVSSNGPRLNASLLSMDRYQVPFGNRRSVGHLRWMISMLLCGSRLFLAMIVDFVRKLLFRVSVRYLR